MPRPQPHPVPLPIESRITAVYPRPDLADAYAMELPQGTASDPEVLARFLFSHQPRWVAPLMSIRDSVVFFLGLKTGRSLRSPAGQRDRIGIFKLYETNPNEVLVGEDDKHLNFRASLLYREPIGPESNASVVLSTVVDCHNLLGRTYLAVIAPFHRRVVKSFLRRAADIGWPRASATPLPQSPQGRSVAGGTLP